MSFNNSYKVKTYYYSYGSGEWMFYNYFDSVSDFDDYLKENGYNKKYFKIEKATQ